MKKKIITIFILFIFVINVSVILVNAQTTPLSNFLFNKGELILNSKNSSDSPVIINSTPHIPGFKIEGRLQIGDSTGSATFMSLTDNENKGYNNFSANAYFNNGWYRNTVGFESWSLSNYVTNNNTGYFRIFHADPQSTSQITNLKPVLSLDSKGVLYVKEIVVSNDWADYVFNKDYKLKSIEELNAFINKNNHLPNIPSAKNILKNGIGVSEMLKLHMEKIEELSLYIIQLNNKNKELELDLISLTKKIENL